MNNLRSVESAGELSFYEINNKAGVVPVVVVDSSRLVAEGINAVLMQAYANDAAINRTLEVGLATFWSVERQQFWTPGAVSGRLLRAIGVYTDEPRNSVMYDVRADFVAQRDGLVRSAPYFRSSYIVE